MPKHPKGKAAHQAICNNLGALILEEPGDRSSDSGNEYESDSKVQHS